MNAGWDKLRHFLNGFTAAVELLNRAGRNGFCVEYVCLATSIVDALLRIGLILQHQIKTKSRDILVSLLNQTNKDKIVFERRIYQMALEEGILSPELFAQLENLYDRRNKIVHRYIISDITTEQVLDIGIEYEKIIPQISEAIRKLEERQIRLGVGMTVAGPDGPKSEMEEWLSEMSQKKHGNPILARSVKRESNI